MSGTKHLGFLKTKVYEFVDLAREVSPLRYEIFQDGNSEGWMQRHVEWKIWGGQLASILKMEAYGAMDVRSWYQCLEKKLLPPYSE